MGRLRRKQLQLFFLPNAAGSFRRTLLVQGNSGYSKRPGLTGKTLPPDALMAQRATCWNLWVEIHRLETQLALRPQIMCAICMRHASSLKFVCTFLRVIATSTSFLSNETAKQLRLVVVLPVPPEFLDPAIPVYHYRAVFHGRCQKVFRPSVMPYIRMETTLCIVEDLLAKLMSSFVSARTRLPISIHGHSAYISMRWQFSQSFTLCQKIWTMPVECGALLNHSAGTQKSRSTGCSNRIYVPETEKNP